MRTKKHYTFIDLFAGLGGFHLAMQQFGGKCVFASELKEDLRKLYQINFPNTRIEGDLTKIDPHDIPEHEILCGGFPCQPFSQAGKRQGFADEHHRGTLFETICSIIDVHHPKYVLLENVANLKGHDHGNTWKTIKNKLEERNYQVIDPEILSPHQFGIPQHRRRIYIVCVNKNKGSLDNFEFPNPTNDVCDIETIIDKNDVNYMPIKPESRIQLEVWQEFINKTVEKEGRFPGFPIWAMEFGADYDYEDVAPASQSVEELRGKKGHLGRIINGDTLEECLKQLPKYAQIKCDKFPSWKIKYIKYNRELYKRNKEWIDVWIKKIEKYGNSHIKLEWNCGGEHGYDIDSKIVQFRPSGIRVKLPTTSPALNLNGTQIPIFPWIELPNRQEEDEIVKGRYMTVREAAKLQGMESLKFGNDEFQLTTMRSYEALGNAVNVKIVKMILNNMLK